MMRLRSTVHECDISVLLAVVVVGIVALAYPMNPTKWEWPMRRNRPSPNPRDDLIKLGDRRIVLQRSRLLHSDRHGVVGPLFECLEMTCVRSDEVASQSSKQTLSSVEKWS
jgi:hypothetical protein